jgi:hypothetical protein
MSLDGVIESPQQWSFTLLQRPRQSDDVPFATLNNTIKKLVVSDSLRSAEWQNTSTIGDADMEALKAKGMETSISPAAAHWCGTGFSAASSTT